MANQIVIPKIGMTMTSATIIEWTAKEGDWVEEGTIVMILETAKVKWELEAESSGFLHILAGLGMELPVGAVAGLLAETKKELEELQKTQLMEEAAVVSGVQERATSSVAEAKVRPSQTEGPIQKGRISISPLARKMAEEHMIDISKVRGTGAGGRIVKEDIEREIEERKVTEITAPREGLPGEIYDGRHVRQTLPLQGMRKAIAEHMHRSLSISAQLTIFGEFDAGNLVKLRENFVAREDLIGVRITYTDILVFVIARALKDHRDINCSLIDGEIKIWENVNIGVAVALGIEGLIVPVIKNADQKSLLEISKERKALVDKARSEKLVPDEVTGGTFTLTSIGAVGVTYFQTPVINQPESAILATGPIREKPVARYGEITIAPVMNCSLTFDHRVINGFGAEQFLKRLGDLVEHTELLLL